jgi:hypothetical protein
MLQYSVDRIDRLAGGRLRAELLAEIAAVERSEGWRRDGAANVESRPGWRRFVDQGLAGCARPGA